MLKKPINFLHEMELSRIPGTGCALARAIGQLRQHHGNLTSESLQTLLWRHLPQILLDTFYFSYVYSVSYFDEDYLYDCPTDSETYPGTAEPWYYGMWGNTPSPQTNVMSLILQQVS